MKKILSVIILLIISNTLSAQIGINKPSVNGESTILDFEDSASNTRGIIIPAVDNTSNALSTNTSSNNGTFLFDKSDNKVKMYQNNTWIALTDSGDGAKIISNTTSEVIGNQTVIIGASSSRAKGVMVLESDDKAIILPKIQNPHLNVKNAYPGMMCYDTSSKSLAVYDGTAWNYWK